MKNQNTSRIQAPDDPEIAYEAYNQHHSMEQGEHNHGQHSEHVHGNITSPLHDHAHHHHR